jgi:uncharacterized protein YeaO (DUF488 family)
VRRVLKIKRAYEDKKASDGKRILIDRLWPRGVRKTEAGIDEWLKELAPSTELRRWFGHVPEKWEEFKRRYKKELAAPEKIQFMGNIAHTAKRADITLIYSARDSEHSDVKVLEELITERMQRTVISLSGKEKIR